MKDFFEAIAYFFENILLAPFAYLREVEATNWWVSNAVSWLYILILAAAVVYWIGKLREYDKDEDKTQTGHSFLK